MNNKFVNLSLKFDSKNHFLSFGAESLLIHNYGFVIYFLNSILPYVLKSYTHRSTLLLILSHGSQF